MKAIGIIETRGLTGAIEAADTMVKSASVTIVKTEKIGSGLVSVVIQGDVAAVKAAIESGYENASKIGEVVAVNVIPRPVAELEKILGLSSNTNKK